VLIDSKILRMIKKWWVKSGLRGSNRSHKIFQYFNLIKMIIMINIH
jgi:hypothetical protein